MPRRKEYRKHKSDSGWMDEKRAYGRKWIKSYRSRHPFRHFSNDFYHRKKAEISPFQLWRIAKRQRLICPLTGRRLTGEIMSIDHKVSLSRGGSNDLSNLQFVHVDANYAKRILSQEDFIQMCRDVTEFHRTLTDPGLLAG